MKLNTAAKLFTLLGFATSAHAVNLVQNGSFETTTLTSSNRINTTNVSNWSTSSYSFLVFPGASITGINGGASLTLFGPGPNSATTAIPQSPDGGKFVAADGDFGVSSITQTINGLVNGSTYALNFYQAASQQQGFSGSYADNFSVSLGAQTQLSEVMNDPSKSYTPWKMETLLFTATGTQEVLSFTAIGSALAGATPGGGPPFTLLDGVSLTQTPEPGSIWMLGGALVSLSAGLRKLRTAKKA